jgi:hypothetical protein
MQWHISSKWCIREKLVNTGAKNVLPGMTTLVKLLLFFFFENLAQGIKRYTMACHRKNDK